MTRTSTRLGSLAIAAVVGLGGLTACSKGASGTVTSKDTYRTSSDRKCTGSGSKRRCRSTGGRTNFTLRLSDGGTCKVSQTEYGRIMVGQTYSC